MYSSLNSLEPPEETSKGGRVGEGGTVGRDVMLEGDLRK